MSEQPSNPVVIEERVISSFLNSSMLLSFLMGIYSMIYAGTMYRYLTKPAKMGGGVVGLSISTLYLLCFSFFILQWHFLSRAVVIDGDSRESIFYSKEGGPRPISVITTLLFYSSITASDALLTWRCYHVWGRSFRVICTPLILIISDIGLSITLTILSGLFSPISSPTIVHLDNSINIALTFSSLATTLMTTSLIGYKVHRTAQLHDMHARKLVKHVIRLFIESSAVYSLVLLISAITTSIPIFSMLHSPLSQASDYLISVLIIVAGMSPTIVVARLGGADPNTFKFQRQSGGRTDAVGEVNASTQIGQWRAGSRSESGGIHSA